MLVAGPSYGLGGRPLSLCDSTTSVAKSSLSGSSSNSSRYSLIKTFAEHLNRGTELIKKILPSKKLSPNSSLQLLSPSKIHRSEDTPESDSGDSLKTEICHFEPICKMPPTPKQISKFNQTPSVLKHPKPRPLRSNNTNKFKPPKIVKKFQRSPSSAFLCYSKIFDSVEPLITNTKTNLPVTNVSKILEKNATEIKTQNKLSGSQNVKRKLSLSSSDHFTVPHSTGSVGVGGKRKKVETVVAAVILQTKIDEDNQNNNKKNYNLRQKQSKIVPTITTQADIKSVETTTSTVVNDCSANIETVVQKKSKPVIVATTRRSTRIKKGKAL